MAKLIPQIKVDYVLKLELNEDEAGALDALVGYGTKEFLNVFYNHLGKAYMEPHEKGLTSLFERIKAQIPDQLHTVGRARKLISEQLAEINKQ